MNLVRHIESAVTRPDFGKDEAPLNVPLRRRFNISLKMVAFALLVIIPISMSLIYTLFLAVTLYKSEASFAIRSRSGDAPASGLGQITQQLGVGLQGGNDFHAVSAFLKSDEALDQLEQKVGYRAEIIRRRGDPLLDMRLNPTATATLQRFRKLFEVRASTFEQIVTIEARAFSPEMAQTVAAAGIDVAESFVNHMNLRANQDFLKYSNTELHAAQEQIRNTRTAITAWRNANGSVNPAMEIQTVQGNLNTLEQELSRVGGNVSRYSTPRVQTLRESRLALTKQIEKERARLAGSSAALAPLIAEYEELVIERDLADRQYEAATEALMAAQQEVSQQQKYVVTVSKATYGDEPDFPRLFFHNASLALASLALYLIFLFGNNVFSDYRQS